MSYGVVRRRRCVRLYIRVCSDLDNSSIMALHLNRGSPFIVRRDGLPLQDGHIFLLNGPSESACAGHNKSCSLKDAARRSFMFGAPVLSVLSISYLMMSVATILKTSTRFQKWKSHSMMMRPGSYRVSIKYSSIRRGC